MSPRILVTGGTGTLGSLVVPLLREAGEQVRVLSRHARPPADGVEYTAVDLLANGEGLDAALDGVQTVLHLAGGPRGDDVATRNLVEAARRAGTVRHLVLISVIGADEMPIGYFRRKLASEWALADSGIGWTVLRAAQFHSLTLSTVRTLARLPLLPAPRGLRLQPVDEREVAERLAGLTLGKPAGLVPDLAGPRVYALDELGRHYLRAVGKRRARLPVRIPGKTGRLYRQGANLSLQGQTGERSWEDYIAEHTEPAGRVAARA
ncbi:MAG TPA: NAD(P)H-binding protein [Actinospica sp.]|jgi:uncharacterized protein YbjT (DUF2867 family)|nr:NAD(P)H-binding protein [Actinospica sp.]